MTGEHNNEAAQAFAEGLQHMVTFYQNLPQAFTDLVIALRQLCLESCQKAGLEPHKNLLTQFD